MNPLTEENSSQEASESPTQPVNISIQPHETATQQTPAPSIPVSGAFQPKGLLRPLQEWAWEAGILALCIIVIIALWMVKIGECAVKVEAQSNTVTVWTNGDWSQEEDFSEERSASGRRIRVDYVNTIVIPALGQQVSNKFRNARLEING